MAEIKGSKLAPITPDFLIQSRGWIDQTYDTVAKAKLMSKVFYEFGTSVEDGYHTAAIVTTLDFIEFARTQLAATQTSTHDPGEIDSFVKEHFGNWHDGVKTYVDIWLEMAKHIPKLSDDSPHTLPIKIARNQRLDVYRKAQQILARNS